MQRFQSVLVCLGLFGLVGSVGCGIDEQSTLEGQGHAGTGPKYKSVKDSKFHFTGSLYYNANIPGMGNNLGFGGTLTCVDNVGPNHSFANWVDVCQ